MRHHFDDSRSALIAAKFVAQGVVLMFVGLAYSSLDSTDGAKHWPEASEIASSAEERTRQWNRLSLLTDTSARASDIRRRRHEASWCASTLFAWVSFWVSIAVTDRISQESAQQTARVARAAGPCLWLTHAIEMVGHWLLAGCPAPRTSTSWNQPRQEWISSHPKRPR